MIKYEIIDISEISDKDLKACFSYINKEKQDKIKRYSSSLAQKLSIGGEWLARKLLSDYCKLSPYDIIISRDELGKPYTPNLKETFFSISHSGNFVAAVISDRPVGIDIEMLRLLSVKASRKICCNEELYYIFGGDTADMDFDKKQPPHIIKRFLEIWTAKEAYYKCIGTGIKNPKSLNTLSCNANLMKFEEKNCLICIAVN